MSVNSVTLIGFVSRDPEIKEVGGVKCATFSLPTTKKFKGKDGNIQEKTQWHNIVAWRTQADIVEKYVKKGTQLYIDGEIDYHSWESNGEKKYMTNIVVNSLQLLSSKNSQESQESQSKKFDPRSANSTAMPYPEETDDSDLPF